MSDQSPVTAEAVLVHASQPPQPQAPVEPTDKSPEVPQPAEAKPEVNPQFAEKFAILTKKEKELYYKEQQMKDIQKRIQRYEELEKLKNENPYAFIKETGIDLEKTLLAAAKEGEEPTVDDKVSELQKRIDELMNKLQEKEQFEAKTKEERALEQFKSNLKDHIIKKADEYELIHTNEAYDTVFDVIETHYKNTQAQGQGEILDFDKASQLVESYLLDKAKKTMGAKKLQSLFQAQAPQPQTKAQFQQTLSSSMGASPSSTTVGRLEPSHVAIKKIAEQFKNKI